MNDPLKPGNTVPTKADPSAQEQPGLVEPEPPAAETAPKTAPRPQQKSPSEARQPLPLQRRLALLRKRCTVDIGTTTAGKEAAGQKCGISLQKGNSSTGN